MSEDDPIATLFQNTHTDAPESIRSRAREVATTYLARESGLPLAPGDVAGAYEIVRVLGAGGQAVVYEAIHREGPEPERRVALKVPRRDTGDRLVREAKLVATLDHPSIVRVLDLSLEGSVPFLVLELCEKGSLEERLEIVHPDGLPLEQVRAAAAAILDALAYAHERGVVHRDVKPANVLFDKNHLARVSDFGIGTISCANEVAVSHDLSQLSLFAGTPLYLAPEQENPDLRVDGKLDGRADLFAFGKVLFQMLTGASPRTIRPPSRLRPGLDPVWDDYVFKLTEERPERRFESAREALEELPPLEPRRRRERRKTPPPSTVAPESAESPDKIELLKRRAREIRDSSVATRDKDGARSLAEILRQRRTVPVLLARVWIAEVARALAPIHADGLVDRNVRPENIFIDEARSVVRLGAPTGPDTTLPRLTKSGRYAAGSFYLSPEQCRGLPADARSDIYSLGLVLYVAVTGVHPFERSSTIQNMVDMAKGQIAPPESSPPLSEAERCVLGKMLEVDRGRRYQSATELLHDLERLHRGELVSAGPPTLWGGSAPKKAARRLGRRAKIAVATAVLTIVALGAGGIHGLFSEDRRRLDELERALRTDEDQRREQARVDGILSYVHERMAEIEHAHQIWLKERNRK